MHSGTFSTETCTCDRGTLLAGKGVYDPWCQWYGAIWAASYYINTFFTPHLGWQMLVKGPQDIIRGMGLYALWFFMLLSEKRVPLYRYSWICVHEPLFPHILPTKIAIKTIFSNICPGVSIIHLTTCFQTWWAMASSIQQVRAVRIPFARRTYELWWHMRKTCSGRIWTLTYYDDPWTIYIYIICVCVCILIM